MRKLFIVLTALAFLGALGCSPVIRMNVRAEYDKDVSPIRVLKVMEVTAADETGERYSGPIRHLIKENVQPFIDAASLLSLYVPKLVYTKTPKKRPDGKEYIDVHMELKAEIRRERGTELWEGFVYVDAEFKPATDEEIDRRMLRAAVDKLVEILPFRNR